VGVTPFLLAAAAADVDMMNLLLRHGADLLLKSKDGSNALMFAAGVGRVDERESKSEEANALEAVKLALTLRNDINATNGRVCTALHGAVGIGADSIVEFLAANGAAIDAKDRQGNTPLRVAAGRVPRVEGANRIYEETAKLLLK